MADFNALIIAAGRGMRMGARGREHPKGFLQIEGRRIIERSVGMLRAHGVGHIRIVTGHLADQYEALFAGVGDVECLHNPLYAETGSLRSMLTGLEGLEGPVVIVESDLVYERRALAPVTPGETVLVISGETKATDEQFVWVRDTGGPMPAFEEMSKNRHARPEPHFGEHTGITGFSAEMAERLRQVARQVLSEDPKSEYEPSLVRLAQEADLPCCLIEDLAWAEIDDEAMYERALKTVWPRIVENDAVSA
ncbi:NTP transferase domain-containing protein [Salinihabitans flavidus]|nr:phosphocholine cytidylyltransferase family protein [Salinihabitans flavidus]